MAPKRKHSSPTLTVQITAEHHARAVKSASGGCLIADAIKEQYPQFTGVTVDMATIRVSDRKAGVRYTYLTPPVAQHLLLSFDQGWPQPTEQVIVKRAVKITPITNSRRHTAGREARLRELEAKEARGEELLAREKDALTKLRSRGPRPSTTGPVDVHIDERGAVVHGGNNLPQGKSHPNLLRGRDRHFGAKLADPGQAFNDAVDAAVAERLAADEAN